MKNTANPRLSWKQADYKNTKHELPDSLLNDSVHTEGELFSREELAEWIKDTRATFCIIGESDKEKFEELYQEYLVDVKYLQSIGKIDLEEAEAITNKDLFTF